MSTATRTAECSGVSLRKRKNCDKCCVLKKVDKQLCCALAHYFSKRTEEERDKTSAMLAKLNTQLQQNEETMNKLNAANVKLEEMKCIGGKQVETIKQLTESEQQLSNKVCILERQLADMKEACVEKDKRMSALEQELNCAKDTSKGMSEEIVVLKNEMATLKEENCLFNSAVAPRVEKYKQFNKEIQEFEKKIETSRRILSLIDQKQEEISKFLVNEVNANCEVLSKCSKLITDFTNSSELNKDVNKLFKAMEKVCQSLKSRVLVSDFWISLLNGLSVMETRDAVTDLDLECFRDLTRENEWFKQAITHLMKMCEETNKKKAEQQIQEQIVNDQLCQQLEKCKETCKQLADKCATQNEQYFSLMLKFNGCRRKLELFEEIEKSKQKSSRRRSITSDKMRIGRGSK